MNTELQCEPHTKNDLGYMEMSHYSKVLHRAGYRQRRCAGCKLYVVWYHRDTEEFLQEITLAKNDRIVK